MQFHFQGGCRSAKDRRVACEADLSLKAWKEYRYQVGTCDGLDLCEGRKSTLLKEKAILAFVCSSRPGLVWNHLHISTIRTMS